MKVLSEAYIQFGAAEECQTKPEENYGCQASLLLCGVYGCTGMGSFSSKENWMCKPSVI